MLASNETIVTNQKFECESCGDDKPASAFSSDIPDCNDCLDQQERNAAAACGIDADGNDTNDEFDSAAYQDWYNNLSPADLNDYCDC